MADRSADIDCMCGAFRSPVKCPYLSPSNEIQADAQCIRHFFVLFDLARAVKSLPRHHTGHPIAIKYHLPIDDNL